MSGFSASITQAMVLDLALDAPECMTTGSVHANIESLVREHARLAFRIGYSVLRNHADAEDVVQEVFLRVSRHGARGIDDPKAWISRIAWRVAVDRYRGARRAEQEEFDERIHAPIARVAGSEQAAISRQTLAILEKMIAALPKKERDALLLTSVEELSSAEAATILGTSETSVRARVFRARQRLMEKMKQATGGTHGR
jgi:RNA polymerase sigma-70 factor, ECF subfamily